MSNIPAVANLATTGIASIDSFALSPADAKKNKDSAASVEDILNCSPIARAEARSSPFILSERSPMMDIDWESLSSNFENDLTETVAIVTAAAPAARAILAAIFPMFAANFLKLLSDRFSFFWKPLSFAPISTKASPIFSFIAIVKILIAL